MDVQAKDVPAGRFFAVNDPAPDNVYIMRIPPRVVRVAPDVTCSESDGLCQNITDETFWSIKGDRMVRLIHEDEMDNTEFYV